MQGRRNVQHVISNRRRRRRRGSSSLTRTRIGTRIGSGIGSSVVIHIIDMMMMIFR